MAPYFRRLAAPIGVVLLLLVGPWACSSPTTPSPEISRDRAITIARQYVDFEPTNVDVSAEVVQGRPAWTVTFRRQDGSHGGLGQFMAVMIDGATGEVLSIARS
jgi:hypothetical protein